MSKPLQEDVARLIGVKRRCAVCDGSAEMYWIPDAAWQQIVPPHRQHCHVCFDCLCQCYIANLTSRNSRLSESERGAE